MVVLNNYSKLMFLQLVENLNELKEMTLIFFYKSSKDETFI